MLFFEPKHVVFLQFKFLKYICDLETGMRGLIGRMSKNTSLKFAACFANKADIIRSVIKIVLYNLWFSGLGAIIQEIIA